MKASGPFVFTLGALQVEDALARWSDAFVAPATSISATTSIVARELVVGSESAPPARIEIHTAAAPLFERFSLEGSLSLLPVVLNYHAAFNVHAGDFKTAAVLADEVDSLTQATGVPPLKYAATTLAAARGDQADRPPLDHWLVSW